MPRFSKYNDAVRYDLRWKNQAFTQKALNDLCDKIAQTSGYKMIVCGYSRRHLETRSSNSGKDTITRRMGGLIK